MIMEWLAVMLVTLAVLMVIAVLVLHVIDNRNTDNWDNE